MLYATEVTCKGRKNCVIRQRCVCVCVCVCVCARVCVRVCVCVLQRKTRSGTTFFCTGCELPLHSGDCYSRYHALKPHIKGKLKVCTMCKMCTSFRVITISFQECKLSCV
jgi:hypothetical protein